MKMSLSRARKITTVRVPNITWTVFAIRTLHNQGLLGRSQITFSASLRTKWTWPHTFTILFPFIHVHSNTSDMLILICWSKSTYWCIFLISMRKSERSHIKDQIGAGAHCADARLIDDATLRLRLRLWINARILSVAGQKTISRSTPHHVGPSCPPGVCSDKTTENNKNNSKGYVCVCFIHSFICIYSFINLFIHFYLYIYICVCVFIYVCIHVFFTYLFISYDSWVYVYLFTYLSIFSFIHLFIYSCIYLFIHVLIYWFIDSFISLFIYLFIALYL